MNLVHLNFQRIGINMYISEFYPSNETFDLL